MNEALSGAEFKKQLREGRPKLGLFLNSHSPTVAEQLAHSGYDWLLVDTQHGPMGFPELSAMLADLRARLDQFQEAIDSGDTRSISALLIEGFNARTSWPGR